MATSLVSALSSIAATITGGSKQGFDNVISMSNDKEISKMASGQLLIFIIVFVISIWFLMLIGSWVFNSSIPRIIPSVRKITVIEFFGLYIVCHILFT